MAHSRFPPRMSSPVTPPPSSLYFRAFHPRRRQETNSNHFQGRLVHPQHMSQASKDFNSSLPSQTLCHPPQCMSKKLLAQRSTAPISPVSSHFQPFLGRLLGHSRAIFFLPIRPLLECAPTSRMSSASRTPGDPWHQHIRHVPHGEALGAK
jgi:hypothetical protein